MFKSALIIALSLTAATAASAQTPYPGPGPLYGAGVIQGGRSYDDWQQTRRDHGLDYDHSTDRNSGYRPYPTVTPQSDVDGGMYYDANGHPRGGIYGNGD
jgi:hypothetical protein